MITGYKRLAQKTCKITIDCVRFAISLQRTFTFDLGLPKIRTQSKMEYF